MPWIERAHHHLSSRNWEKDLDGFDRRVHLGKAMSMIRQITREAIGAAFAVNRGGLLGGDYGGWTGLCSIPVQQMALGLQRREGRGG